MMPEDILDEWDVLQFHSWIKSFKRRKELEAKISNPLLG